MAGRPVITSQRANNLRQRAQAAEQRLRQAGTRTSYAELADVLDALPRLLAEARHARKLNLRDAALQIGVSHTTLHRIEQGDGIQTATAVQVRWLSSDQKQP